MVAQRTPDPLPGRWLGTSATANELKLQVHRPVRHRTIQTYRYYICFTHSRSGPQACNATRIPAEETDTAALGPLAAFYTQETAVRLTSFDRCLARQNTGQDERQAQANAVAAQVQAQPSRRAPLPGSLREWHHERCHRRPALRELQQELIALKARQPS